MLSQSFWDLCFAGTMFLLFIRYAVMGYNITLGQRETVASFMVTVLISALYVVLGIKFLRIPVVPGGLILLTVEYICMVIIGMPFGALATVDKKPITNNQTRLGRRLLWMTNLFRDEMNVTQ